MTDFSSKDVISSVDSSNTDSVDLIAVGELVGELWSDSIT